MLTRSGLGAVIAAVCLGGFGLWWDYEELIVAGVGIAVLTLTSIWAAKRPLRATITRRVATIRVPRGDPVNIAYRIRNTSRFRTGRATIVDRCDTETCRIELDHVAPNTAVDFFGSLATHRRGVFDVGPYDVERIDPFWLAVGTTKHDVVGSVTVHPKVYQVIGPHGATRVVESDSVLRRASSDPMSGFVSMREYVAGDDPRLIHWPTTARTGTLMVRENVEVRRPEFTVVLDTSRNVGTSDDFEEAVDVAATLAAHAIRSGLDVVVRTTNPNHAGRTSPLVDEGSVLDLLTPVTRSDDGELLTIASLFSRGFDHTSVVMVTGPTGPSSRFASLEQMLVVRIGVGAENIPGVAVAAVNAAEFVTRWKAWT